MSKALMYYEMFNEFEKAPNKNEKISVLQKYGSQDRTFVAILVAVFHPEVKFYPIDLKDYKPSDAPPGMGYGSLSQEIQRVYIFQNPEGMIKDVWRPFQPKQTLLSEERRYELLLQILESFERHEADVFIGMLKKNLNVKGLTSKIVKEAFPGLLP